MSAQHSISRWQVDGVGLLVLGLLTGVAYMLVVQPIARRQAVVTKLRSELAGVQNESEAAQESRGRINVQLMGVRRRLEAVPVNLEPAAHLNRRITSIMELASDAGVLIHESRAGTVQPSARYDRVPIVVSGDGAYPACAAFLHRLHNGLQDVEVTGLELRGNPAAPGTPSRFQFDLVWFAAPEGPSGTS